MTLRHQILPFMNSILSIMVMSAAFCCWVLLCVWAVQHLPNQTAPIDSAVVAAADATDSTPQVKITNELRYTAMGWQTPSHWIREPTQVSQLSIARLHPIVLGFGILLASLLAIVLFSPDQEVERLLKAAKLRDESTASFKLNKLRETNRS